MSKATISSTLGKGSTVEGVLPGDNVLLTPVNAVALDVRGRLLHADLGRNAGAGAKLENLLFVLHFAIYGGLAVKLLYCLLGGLSGSLSVTGALLWWRRERQAKLKNQPAAARRLPATSSQDLSFLGGYRQQAGLCNSPGRPNK